MKGIWQPIWGGLYTDFLFFFFSKIDEKQVCQTPLHLWSGIEVKNNSISIFFVVLSTCCVVLSICHVVLSPRLCLVYFGHILKAGLDSGKNYSGITLLQHLLKFCRKRKRNNVLWSNTQKREIMFFKAVQGSRTKGSRKKVSPSKKNVPQLQK